MLVHSSAAVSKSVWAAEMGRKREECLAEETALQTVPHVGASLAVPWAWPKESASELSCFAQCRRM